MQDLHLTTCILMSHKVQDCRKIEPVDKVDISKDIKISRSISRLDSIKLQPNLFLIIAMASFLWVNDGKCSYVTHLNSFSHRYHLVMTNIAMENHHFQLVNHL